MTHYPGLEDYTPPSVGDRVMNAGETSLSVENYGRLRLLIDQGNDNFAGSMHELEVERDVHIQNVRQHISISAA